MAAGVRQEGTTTFQVGNAFYRAESQISRDLGVLAVAVQRQRQAEFRVLDATTGCGVRALRYVLEGGATAVWANDADPEVGPILTQNLAQLAPEQVRVTHWEANRVFADCLVRRDYYDLVDLDCFGTPAPYVSSILGATRLGGLIYLTSTDGRTISGRSPADSLRLYGTYARSHPSLQEQGLRILLGGLSQQASARGFGIEPVFSLYIGQIYRVMVRLVSESATYPDCYGFLGYCHGCGDYQCVDWRRLNRAQCLHHPTPQPLTLSGPMWLGPLHGAGMLQPMMELAGRWDWGDRYRLLEVMAQEASLPPYLIPLGEIGRRGKMDIPNRDRLIAALRDQGFRASPTHLDSQAIKTDAAIAQCLEIARTC
ncbi:N(2),N(2)-dimethylguanosine tRNA methyltransferase [Geitlerinema sp. PCC 7407]|uniref:N(2),N(2)-dimethylguanosine tRNA methyltransferase n=1 Tax=Geitlerinema sp. PCC 7407 TaxID=1173025 RepID=UPI00029F99CB|nr:N(2),N(2)-dimethylguanosine tRNA methyltransferase [Geitlerinema sp. PCC 7407]AFY66253.1 N(2),N(2)-dimethylguanosine tRNA methyltransferase [Geitlerinema sp. PCC 7407]